MAASRVRSKSPLVVIVGPTASGKTAIAVEIAKKYGGEIICADSRTIYKEMNIGTAKPTTEEQKQIPHFGLDLVKPNERFSVADFKEYALREIAQIRSRGNMPLLVGGTGLYIDSVLFDFDFTEPKKQSADWRRDIIADTFVVGIATNKNVLRRRIAARAEQLFANGVVEEATRLGKKYSWNSHAMTGNIYPIVHAYLKNELTLEESVAKFTTQDWQLAKRQMTWFRPNPFIEWCNLSEVESYIDSRIASEYYL